jgi:hypothetical protein
MTLAGWSVRKMPLQVPQEPIITEKKNGGGVTTPAPLAVPGQDATVRTNPITGELNVRCQRRTRRLPVGEVARIDRRGAPTHGTLGR